MNKTTEALKLAEEALEEFFYDAKEQPELWEALAAIREALAEQDHFATSGKPIDHIASTGKMIGCAYCDNPLFAGTKCNNCGRVTLAEPVKQEPVGYTAQSVIDWLSSDERTDVAEAEIRLKKKPSGRSNVPLYAAPVDAIAIRAEALEEAAKVIESWSTWDLFRSAGADAIRRLK